MNATPPSDPIFQYLTGQLRPEHPALLAAYEAEGAKAVGAMGPALDVAYGPHVRQRFDFFAAPNAAAAFAYFHAGYWQARDKAQFRFLAPTLVAAGFDVALCNYPLCPDATLETLTEAVRGFAPAFRKYRGPARLIVAGHSAGAHLAVELALTDWSARGESPDPIAGVVALSGVYDLEPLIATPLNDRLRLDSASARAASPIWRVRDKMPPAIFAVGGAETPAFQAQNAAMHAAWTARGNPGRTMVVEGADHFTLLRALNSPGAPLFEAVVALGRASDR